MCVCVCGCWCCFVFFLSRKANSTYNQNKGLRKSEGIQHIFIKISEDCVWKEPRIYTCGTGGPKVTFNSLFYLYILIIIFLSDLLCVLICFTYGQGMASNSSGKDTLFQVMASVHWIKSWLFDGVCRFWCIAQCDWWQSPTGVGCAKATASGRFSSPQ